MDSIETGQQMDRKREREEARRNRISVQRQALSRGKPQ